MRAITVTTDPSRRVMTAFVNTFDMLSADEVRKYPGTALTRENFDNHIIIAMQGERTRVFYLKDGASQDVGPTELDEADAGGYGIDVSDFDFNALNRDEQLADMLSQIVRNEVEAELAEYE